MKKSIASILSMTLALASLAACGAQGTAPAASSGASSEAQTTASEPEVVTYWYFHTGDEAKVEEEAIAAYNASQSKYKVEGLSVSDQQKLIVALASNEAPDAIFSSNSNLTTYYSNGLLQKLDDYISADSFDMGAFSAQAVESATFDGGVYGLPTSAVTIQMFYNKDLLAAAGYTDPPQTMEELYEMAEKITTLDANGDIDVLGYPLFPFASARQELIYAFGGRWWAEDGVTLTPDSQGVLDSLKMNVAFRQKYGTEKVQAFIGTANTNRYTEQDMFFTGKQLFRFDGPWLATMIAANNPDLNYGITLVPGTKADPTLRGVSRYETSAAAIPVSASNKEGAWDFIKWLSGPVGAKIIDCGVGHPPARTDLYEDAEVLSMPAFAEFIESLKLEQGVQYPKIKDYAKYISLIDEHLDYVYNGTMSPEDAMAALAEQANGLS